MTLIYHESLLFWFDEDSDDFDRAENETITVAAVLLELAKAGLETSSEQETANVAITPLLLSSVLFSR
jgi:hypothetical protein